MKKLAKPLIIIALIFILILIPPINTTITGNLFGRFLFLILHNMEVLYPFVKDYQVTNLKPNHPQTILRKYGLHEKLMSMPMPIWKNMQLDKENISINHGTNYFSIGKKTFWAKTTFLDPADEIRYHLWYGIYMIPLNHVSYSNLEKSSRKRIFGYNPQTKEIDQEEKFQLVQYYYYKKKKKRTPKIFKENSLDFHQQFQFKQKDLTIEESPLLNHCWIMKGEVSGRSLMNQSKKPMHQFFTAATGGWIPENNEKNFSQSRYKGRLVIVYRDQEGNPVAPNSEKAKILTVGYVFGIHWDNGNKETSDLIMDNLANSMIQLSYQNITQ